MLIVRGYRPLQSRGFTIVLTLVLVGLLLYAFWNHAQRVAFSQQWEYREGALLIQVRALQAGIDLYRTESLPQYLNVYGWLYPALATFLAPSQDIGFPFLRAISAAALLAAASLVYHELRAFGASRLLSAVLATTLYAHTLHHVTPLARPDGVGVLIYVVGLVAGCRCKPSVTSAVLITGLAILGFLTKAYFVLIAPLIFSYWILFLDLRKGLLLGLASAAAGLAFVALLDLTVPGYFTSTIFSQYRGASAPQTAASWHYVALQIKEYGAVTASLLLLLTASAVLWIRNRSSWREMPFVCYALLFMLVALALRLAHSPGAYLTYFFELLSPPLVLAVGWLLTKYVHAAKVANSAAAVALVSTTSAVITVLAPQQWLENWKAEYAVAAHATDGYRHVLATPLLAGYLAQTGREALNTGQNEYLRSDALLAGNPLGLGVPRKELEEVIRSFDDAIVDGIKNQRFDLVVTDQGTKSQNWTTPLTANYTVVSERSIGMWKLQYWQPR